MERATKRILVVDDFEDSRFSLSRLLEIEGYEVVEAADGAQAIEKALSESPDLILMDMSLPIVDGMSATRQIKAQLSRVPIIALSAHDGADYQSRAKEAGCDDYVTKPVDFDGLLSLISGKLV
jgi:CheY-like chemotaxis protein